jgi:atypical dual specificity phosphatase
MVPPPGIQMEPILNVDATIEYLRFKWLVHGKIAGAPHPDLCDGLPAVAPFLRGQGIGAIVTLLDKVLEPAAEELGFHYLFVETPDFQPPPDLRRILAFIRAQHEHGRAVLVHCFAGIGRTGTVLAAWLLEQDPSLSAAQAISRVRDEYVPDYARTRFPEHPSQAEALEQFAKTRGLNS